MRALLSLKPGGPETLAIQQVDEPRPGPGQVSVTVHACGVNFPDLLVIEDRYQMRPIRPFSPGSELAGVVRAVAQGAGSLRVGQRVSATLPFGAMAEVVVVSADRCTPIPDDMPFDEAAAFQVTFGTVHYALVARGGLRSGETLVVLGAGGGIGLAAVSLGKALGARVVAAASSEEKLDAALSMGADAGVLYARPFDEAFQRERFIQDLRAACGGGGADVVIDPLGGPYSEAAFRSLARRGRHLVVGFAAGIPSISLDLTQINEARITGVFWGEYMAREPQTGAAEMKALMDLYAAGRIRPLVSARYSLERGGEALSRLAGSASVGKIVVEVIPSDNRMIS